MSDVFTHSFDIGAGHPCFEGHFPTYPVFPAVAQLSLLTEALSRLHGQPCVISTIPVVKFLRPVGPDSTVVVELRSRGENSTDFTVNSPDGVVAKGQLTYRILE